MTGLSLEGGLQVYLAKADSVGNLLWEETVGKGGGLAIALAPDGGYVVAGFVTGTGVLLKTDSEGNLLWEKNFEDPLTSIQKTVDGGYVVAGSNFYLAKTDAVGDVEWERTFGGADTAAEAVQETTRSATQSPKPLTVVSLSLAP